MENQQQTNQINIVQANTTFFERLISSKITTVIVFILNLGLIIYVVLTFIISFLTVLAFSPVAIIFCDSLARGTAGFANCTGIYNLFFLLSPIILALPSIILIFFKKQERRVLSIALLLVGIIITISYIIMHPGGPIN